MLRKLILTTTILLIWAGASIAQLSGNYTVGPEGDYPTLKSAIADLKIQGNNGNVTFLITDDLQETQNIAIGYDPGEANTIRIKPAPGTTPVITFSSAETNGTYDGFIVIGLSDINGGVDALTFTRNIVIDGSNSNSGTSRDLTLRTSSSASDVSTLRILAETDNIEISNSNIIFEQSGNPFNSIRITSRADGLHNDIRIINNRIENVSANSSRAIIVDGITSAQNGPNLTITGNTMITNRYGVWLRQVGGNTLIENNTIEVTQSGNFFGYGVLVDEVSSDEVSIRVLNNTFDGSSSNNTIVGVRASANATYEIHGNQFTNLTSEGGITRGVWVDAGGAYDISFNKFNGLDGTGVRMIEITNNLTEDHNVMITNNLFTGFMSSTGSSGRLDGIYITSPTGALANIGIYHNTLIMNPLEVTGAGWEYFGISTFSSVSVTVDMKNNIFVNNDNNSGVISYLYRQAFSAASILSSDYNVWYVAHPSVEDQTFISRHGGTETNSTTLEQHQTNTGFDSNSTSFMVEFEEGNTPALDESMAGNVLLLAPRLANVQLDYFGNSRQDPTHKGAYEPQPGTSVTPVLEIPTLLHLHQNYPNPFNPTTTIQFDLNQAALVTLSVYSIDGRLISTLIQNENRQAGTHFVTFNATNLASGIYLYRLSAAGQVNTGRMTLVK